MVETYKNTGPNSRVCKRCGGYKPAFYSINCRKCYIVLRKEESTKHVSPYSCKLCSKDLGSDHKNTKYCRKCWLSGDVKRKAWNEGTKGKQVAWNKGISIYSSDKEKKDALNRRRREKYTNLSPLMRITERIRTRIRNGVNHHRKNRNSATSKHCSTVELLGCSFADFLKYIESKFLPGMGWDNYGNRKGQWNIDHIIPVSRFNLLKHSEQHKCFHFSNCRPMWAIDNVRKGNRF